MASPLIHVLSEIATTSPKAVLMNGQDYWRIEDLLAQARRDQKGHPELREGKAYSWDSKRGKIVVTHYQVPVFWEPGTDL